MADKKLLEAFGRRIKQLRTERGLSQEELAFQTGFHRTYIGMVERSVRYTPFLILLNCSQIVGTAEI